MRYTLMPQNVKVPNNILEVIETKVAKVEERLKRYHPESAHMEIWLEEESKTSHHQCSLLLKAFRDELVVKKTAPEQRTVVDKSFEVLFKAIDHYRLKVNKSMGRNKPTKYSAEV